MAGIKVDPRYIQMTVKKPVIKPIDIIDVFWQYKYSEEDPNCRERDFLRFTQPGRFFINAQIIRPYFLFFFVLMMIIYVRGEVN